MSNSDSYTVHHREAAKMLKVRLKPGRAAAASIAVMNARLVNLGLGATCSRCGGCGQFSFNTRTGTTCFGCDGAGATAPKIDDGLIGRLKKLHSQGVVDQHLEGIAMRVSARNASKQVLDAWSNTRVSSYYNWTRAGKKLEPDHTISEQFNEPMHAAYQHVRKLSEALTKIGHQIGRAPDPQSKQVLRMQQIEAAKALVEARDIALKEIADLQGQLDEFVAKLPNTASEVCKGPGL